MENYRLLTLSDLMERWNKSERTIRKYIADGKLKHCENLGLRFRPEEVARFEGGEVRDFNYIERRNLLAEIELWKERYKKLNNILNETLQVVSKVPNINIENFNIN